VKEPEPSLGIPSKIPVVKRCSSEGEPREARRGDQFLTDHGAGLPCQSLLLGSDRLKPRSRGGVDVVACSVCKGDLAAVLAAVAAH
jgi:hypothetical protein